MQKFALKVKDHTQHYDPGYSLVQLTLVKMYIGVMQIALNCKAR